MNNPNRSAGGAKPWTNISLNAPVMLSDSYICHYIQLQRTITRPKPTAAHESQATERQYCSGSHRKIPAALEKGFPCLEESLIRTRTRTGLGWCWKLQDWNCEEDHPCLAAVSNHGHPFSPRSESVLFTHFAVAAMDKYPNVHIETGCGTNERWKRIKAILLQTVKMTLGEKL